MKRYSFLIIGLLFLLISCFDDDTTLGGQDILTVDTVYLTDLKTGIRQRVCQNAGVRFNCNPGEEIQIVAHGIYAGNEKLHFRWCLLDETEISDKDTLHHVFTPEELGEASIIMLYAYRGDKEAANVYQVGISLNDIFEEGLLVLAKSGGQTLLDYFPKHQETRRAEYVDGKEYNTTFYSYPIQENVFGIYNDGEELRAKDPLNLAYGRGYRVSGLPDPLEAIQLLAKDWRNSVAIDVNGMKKIVYMEEEFVNTPPDDMVVKDFRTVGAMSLLRLENGEIYSRVNYDRGNPCTGKFLTLPLTYKDPSEPEKNAETIHATQIVQRRGTNWCIIFEEEKKRFLFVSTADGDPTGAAIDYHAVFDFNNPYQAYPAGAIPMNNFDKEVRKIFVDPGYDDKLYIIYKDNDGYYLQTCAISAATWSAVHSFFFWVEGSPRRLPASTQELLEQEKCVINIETTDSDPRLILLSVGNKIYSLDWFSCKSTLLVEFEDEVGNDIVAAQKLGTWFTVDYYGAQRSYFAGRFLAVAFANGDLKIIRNYDDPRDPNNIYYELLFEKNYEEGIVDLLYY